MTEGAGVGLGPRHSWPDASPSWLCLLFGSWKLLTSLGITQGKWLEAELGLCRVWTALLGAQAPSLTAGLELRQADPLR